MKKTSLDKFIKIRNNQSIHNNFQFQADADEAGLDLNELGDTIPQDNGGYAWNTPFGLLVEYPGGKLGLQQ